jgi:type II secretory pathway pseudopilin PulG
MEHYKETNSGTSLVEILIAIALAAVILPALLNGFVTSRMGKATEDLRVRATAYLKESQEAARVVREVGWDTFAVNGTYHPAVSGNTWKLLANSETISDFTRSVVISDLATPDPSIKLVTATVAWGGSTASSVSSKEYYTRYLQNTVRTDTTFSDFNSGNKNGTVVTSGGDITLAAGGTADWCAPNLSISAIDLPKSGVASSLTAIEGKAFVGTGDTTSGVSFAGVTISNTNPPVATLGSTFDGYQTNAVFGEKDYAYLATTNNSKEVEIINLNSVVGGKYQEAGYFNASGTGGALSVFVSGNIGYMTEGNKLYTFDLTSKSGSRTQLASITLDATGTQVYVVANYAYVSIAGATEELDIIQISNSGKTLAKVGTADINGQAASSIYINSAGTRAYLGTNAASSQKEFFIVDISTKTGSRPTLGSYETNGMSIKGVTAVPGGRAIVVGTSGEEYQVLNVSNESAPVRCGGLDINSGIKGVSSVLEADGDDYSYLITGDPSAEFKIIRGGSGGTVLNGTFESVAFDAGKSVAFNRFSTTQTQPSGTTVTYQVSGADPVNGSCANGTYTFVGPDGTSNTSYSTGGAIPINTDGVGFENPAQCFKYKVNLTTTTSGVTPVFSDITINYSP